VILNVVTVVDGNIPVVVVLKTERIVVGMVVVVGTFGIVTVVRVWY
jgi:hypothetical protein